MPLNYQETKKFEIHMFADCEECCHNGCLILGCAERHEDPKRLYQLQNDHFKEVHEEKKNTRVKETVSFNGWYTKKE